MNDNFNYFGCLINDINDIINIDNENSMAHNENIFDGICGV